MVYSVNNSNTNTNTNTNTNKLLFITSFTVYFLLSRKG